MVHLADPPPRCWRPRSRLALSLLPRRQALPMTASSSSRRPASRAHSMMRRPRSRRPKAAISPSPTPAVRRSPSRSKAARPPTSSSPPTSTGWTTVEKAKLVKERHAQQLARQHAWCWSAPADSACPLKIAKDFDLAGAVGDGKLAMADVKAVPAGKYGKASLEKLWASGALSRPRSPRPRTSAQHWPWSPPGEAPLRHRLPDRRHGRAHGEGDRHFSRRTPTSRSSILSPS